MGANDLDLDDVAGGHPGAEKELAELRSEIERLEEFALSRLSVKERMVIKYFKEYPGDDAGDAESNFDFGLGDTARIINQLIELKILSADIQPDAQAEEEEDALIDPLGRSGGTVEMRDDGPSLV